jgi:lipoprotein
MKYKNLNKIMAIAVGLSIAATSCNSYDMPDKSLKLSDTPLEIDLLGVKGTRSIIQGTAFPIDSVFSVFSFIGNTMTPVDGENAARVTYSNKKCVFETPVLLPESADVSVYATFPYVEKLDGKDIFVDTKKQIDYLAGYGCDANGEMKYANTGSPSVNICFEHILSRITLNIYKADNVEQSFKIPTIALGGDNEYSYRSAYYNLIEKRFVNGGNYDGYVNIKGEIRDNKYWIETTDDVVTVDFLVIPSETTWGLYIDEINHNWLGLPSRVYEPGKQYIFDCVISAGNVLTISECEIKPWDNTDMPEVEPY